jgi:hypothetical protein
MARAWSIETGRDTDHPAIKLEAIELDPYTMPQNSAMAIFSLPDGRAYSEEIVLLNFEGQELLTDYPYDQSSPGYKSAASRH